MKTMKNFTDGIAVLLVLLLSLWLLLNFSLFNTAQDKLEAEANNATADGEDALNDETEEKGRFELFLDQSDENEYAFKLCLLLATSAFVGFATRGVPLLSTVVTVACAAYAFALYGISALPKYPNAVLILILVHASGAVAFAVAEDRRRRTHFALWGGMLSAAGGVATCVAANAFQRAAAKSASVIDLFAEKNVKYNPVFKSDVSVMERLRAVYESDGAAGVRSLSEELTDDLDFGALKTEFLSNVEAPEATTYLRCAILLGAVALLCFFLCRRGRGGIAALASLLPPTYVFFSVLRGGMSAFPLPVAVLFSAFSVYIVSIAAGAPAAETEGDDEEIFYEIESVPAGVGDGEAVPANEADNGDEIYYD